MKKALPVLTFLLLATSLFATIPQSKFTLSLGGGWGLYRGGDYNEAVLGYNDYLDEFLPDGPGRHEKFSSGFNGQIEGIFWLSPNWGLGLGIGRYGSSISDNRVDFVSGIADYGYVINTSIAVTPVMLNIHYRMPLGPALHLDMYLGAGLYFGCFEFLKDYEGPFFNETGTFEYNGQTTALGFQVGVDVNIPIVKDKIWLSAGVHGRAASLKSFKDDWSDRWSSTLGSGSEAGTGYQFYTYNMDTGDDVFRLFSFRGSPPIGSEYSDIKEGSVGGSALQFRIGAKIEF